MLVVVLVRNVKAPAYEAEALGDVVEELGSAPSPNVVVVASAETCEIEKTKRAEKIKISLGKLLGNTEKYLNKDISRKTMRVRTERVTMSYSICEQGRKKMCIT
jgi:hypothetical protein